MLFLKVVVSACLAVICLANDYSPKRDAHSFLQDAISGLDSELNDITELVNRSCLQLGNTFCDNDSLISFSCQETAHAKASQKCREYAVSHGLRDGIASDDGLGCDFKTELSNSVRCAQISVNNESSFTFPCRCRRVWFI